MDWIRENWFWIVVGALFLWMHTKMHGGHGHAGHGGGHGHGRRPSDPSSRTEDAHGAHRAGDAANKEGERAHAEH